MMLPKMIRLPMMVSTIIVTTASCLFAQAVPDQTELTAADPSQPQLMTLTVEQWPADGLLKLNGPLPSIIKVWLADDSQQTPLEFRFNPTATEITIVLPTAPNPPAESVTLNFLITEKSTLHPDGVYVLSALDATVEGTQAALETHPGSHRIGFWNRAEDFVTWEADLPVGEYQVELVYSRATGTGTQIDVQVGPATLGVTLEKTGSWYHYRVMPIGKVKIEKKGPHPVEIHVRKILNGGVMNLKAFALTPISDS